MTDTAPAERAMPANVIQALARVMEELPGIGRNERSEQGYQYRGIEAITAHAQQLLGKYGVVPVPKVVARHEPKQFSINSRPWTEDHLEVVYTLYGPGGQADSVEVGPLHALGRDNSDKGVNKCMTQAYKYMLLQVLCIGDRKDDADANPAAEADAHPTGRPDPEQWFKSVGWKDEAEHDLRRAEARGDAATLPAEARSKIKDWMRSASLTFEAAWTRAEVDELIARTKSLANEAPPPAQSDESAPAPHEPPDTPDAPSLPLPEPEKPAPKKRGSGGPLVKCAWCGKDIKDEAAVPVIFNDQTRFMGSKCHAEWKAEQESAGAEPF